MGKKKEKPIDLENLTPEEELKLEIAAEIGVYDKVLSGGWRVLSAKESGRIGGLLSRRKRNMQNEDKAKEHASVDG
ncbi:alpha/beta-type small acid-soluble spore protein [Cuneatibacter sp. NSJ-177]|jgi:hypothetical protein|uniref:small, acid-soluble spore protein, alpha/beta type n=1 Tax=Cuneatibacter sp. NSJ-177 TaxID=2931401 RepID=UPI001FD1F2BF|nr:small, acid-soluble spore protein, alpha/beta type [Cuneatibacter sp. NSJ-177]MCJ7834173.1 alpha/beta-type small acid-soluble spore protein [Cuneatibacter sp. NSJ-177]